MPLVLGFFCLSLTACQTHPKEIDGRPVIGVKTVNGKTIYVLGDKSGDPETIRQLAKDAEEAAAGITFGGRK